MLAADAIRTHSTVMGDALVVVGDRVAAVGAIADLRQAWSAPEQVVAGTIIPGLRDAHLHPVGYAAALNKPIITLHPAEHTHALKEVDAAALAVAETPEQVVEILSYVTTRG